MFHRLFGNLLSITRVCSAQELDLSSATTFRDLSKPMGAQTEKRLVQFKKRYNDWEDPQGEWTVVTLGDNKWTL